MPFGAGGEFPGGGGGGGSAGAQGPQGPQGPQGGVQGAQGAQGAQGTQGTAGAQGTQGVQGSQGNQGFQGTQGTQGHQGTQGTPGVNGTQGAQGFQGNPGAQGPQGVQGPQGDPAFLTITSSDGSIAIVDPSGPVTDLSVNEAQPGYTRLRAFNIAFDTPNLDTGVSLFSPDASGNEVVLDVAFFTGDLWNGTTPKADVGSFDVSNVGLFVNADGSLGLVDLTIQNRDTDNGNRVMGGGFSLAAVNAIGAVNAVLKTAGEGVTPFPDTAFVNSPASNAQLTIPCLLVDPGRPFKVVVSQDGGKTSPASSPSTNITFPFVVAAGVNDKFGYGPTGTETQYTVPPGTYANHTTLATAVAAAVDGSSNPFSGVATVTPINTVQIRITDAQNLGVGGNNYDLVSGTTHDVLAGLGYSSPTPLGGGTGGPTGSTAGATTIYVLSAVAMV